MSVPQYHVVLGNKFETVFNNGKTEEQQDAICETLFEGCRERYVEEEFGESGILMYDPLPLDEVWLLESKRRNRKTSLQKQRQRNKRRQKEIHKRCIERSNNHLPKLAESDVESDSDCDSLSDQALVSKARGGDSVVRDLWLDHPMQQVDEPGPLPRPLSKASKR